MSKTSVLTDSLLLKPPRGVFDLFFLWFIQVWSVVTVMGLPQSSSSLFRRSSETWGPPIVPRLWNGTERIWLGEVCPERCLTESKYTWIKCFMWFMFSQGAAGSLNAELMISHLKGVQGLNLSPTGRYPDVLREPHCLFEKKGGNVPN